MGCNDRAMEALVHGRTLADDIHNILSAMGQVRALAGRQAEARALLACLHDLAAKHYVHSPGFALIHMALGETEQALDWLEAGCANREMAMSSLKSHPVYDPLRGEPRFQQLLRKIWPV